MHSIKYLIGCLNIHGIDGSSSKGIKPFHNEANTCIKVDNTVSRKFRISVSESEVNHSVILWIGQQNLE